MRKSVFGLTLTALIVAAAFVMQSAWHVQAAQPEKDKDKEDKISQDRCGTRHPDEITAEAIDASVRRFMEGNGRGLGKDRRHDQCLLPRHRHGHRRSPTATSPTRRSRRRSTC